MSELVSFYRMYSRTDIYGVLSILLDWCLLSKNPEKVINHKKGQICIATRSSWFYNAVLYSCIYHLTLCWCDTNCNKKILEFLTKYTQYM
jgi:hypothetical protein